VSASQDLADVSLIDSGGDWDRRNRLKVYRALHHLSIRDFKEAADLLIDSLSTFTSTELMEYEEFVAYTVLAAGVGCDRKGIKTKVSLSLTKLTLDPCELRGHRVALLHSSPRQYDRLSLQIQLRPVLPLSRRSRKHLPSHQSLARTSCPVLCFRDADKSVYTAARELPKSHAREDVQKLRRQRGVHGSGFVEVYRQREVVVYYRQGQRGDHHEQTRQSKQDRGIRAGRQAGRYTFER